MCWKKLSSWIKGSIIALAIWAIIIMLGIVFNTKNPLCGQNTLMFGLYCGYLNDISRFILQLLSFPLIIVMRSDFSIILFSALCFFVYGALIGWIIGKIKSRNKTKK